MVVDGPSQFIDLRLYGAEMPLTGALIQCCQILPHLFAGWTPLLLLHCRRAVWFVENDMSPDRLRQLLLTQQASADHGLQVMSHDPALQAQGCRLVHGDWQLDVWLYTADDNALMPLSDMQCLSLRQLVQSLQTTLSAELPALNRVVACWQSPVLWQTPSLCNQQLLLRCSGNGWQLALPDSVPGLSQLPAVLTDWVQRLADAPATPAAPAQGRVLSPDQRQLCQLTLVPVAADLLVLCCQDLSQALAMRQLLRQQAFYQGALDSGLTGLIAFDLQHRPVFMNQQAGKLLQLPLPQQASQDFSVDHLRFYDMQEETPVPMPAFAFLQKYDKQKQCHCMVQYQDGTDRILEFRWAVRQDCQRHDIVLYCLCSDITSQYQLRQTLHHIEHHLEHLLHYSPVVLYQQFNGYSHGFIYISPNAERLLGCGQQRLLTEPELFLSLVHVEDRGLLLQPQQVCEYRFWSETEQGYIWLKDIREPDPATAGGVYGALTNVTARKTTELEKVRLIAALEAQQQLVTSTLNGLLDAVLTIDQHGQVLSCNPTVTRLLGYEQAELLGQNVNRLMPEPDATAHDQYLKRYLSGGEARIVGIGRRVMAQHKNGQLIPVHLSVTELPVSKDKIRRFVGCLHDLTELERQQEQLVQAGKLSAIGTLTSGIAHDFNNILGIIRGYAELLSSRQQPEVEKPAQSIIKATDRASFMIKNLLEFSTNRQREKQVLELTALLHEISPLLTEACGSKIRLNLQPPPKPCWLHLEKGGLENALLNLVINARQATEEAGTIECRCGVVRPDTSWLGTDKPVAGEYLRLEVQDSGCGMTDEVKSRIFEPFFSTKGAMGTGLGLAQVHGFIRRCHGVLQVASTPGHGTVFSLYFPLLPALQQQDLQPASPAGAADKTILLVDDETELLELHATMLELAGFHVLKATNGNDALKILSDTPVALLVSDVVMPGLNGLELAARARAMLPALPVQLVSGFADESMITDEMGRELYRQRLYKPLQTSKLVARVRQLTGAEG